MEKGTPSFKKRPDVWRERQRRFMKRNTLHSSWWTAGTLVVLAVLGTGSMAAENGLNTGFTAFNDMAWGEKSTRREYHENHLTKREIGSP